MIPKMIMKADNNNINNALIAFAKTLGYTVVDNFPTDLTEGYISFGTSKEANINYKTKNNPEEYYARKFGIVNSTSCIDVINTLINESTLNVANVEVDNDDDDNDIDIDIDIDFPELLPKFIYKVKQMKKSIKGFNLYYDNDLSEYFLKATDAKVIPDSYTLIGNLFDLSIEHLD